MMLGQTESSLQRKYANSVGQNVIPELADLGQQRQPDGGKKYKERDSDNQIHGTKTEVGERAMHGNNPTAISTRRDRIRQLRDFAPAGGFIATLKIPGRIQSWLRLSCRRGCDRNLLPDLRPSFHPPIAARSRLQSDSRNH